MDTSQQKVRIIAEKSAIIKLFNNNSFYNGGNLQQIFKNLAEIILIIDQDKFDREWNNAESKLRSFFNSFDIPRPKVIPELVNIYKNPLICSVFDPFAFWLFDKSDTDIQMFREYLGIWAASPHQLSDDYFSLDHAQSYERKDEIQGTKDNGWGNFLEQLTNPLPPINSIVVNDRYLLSNTYETSEGQKGFYGLDNMKFLFNELLPQNLKITFHILILCQHPKLNIQDTDIIVGNFIKNIKKLRSYPIEIEFVYDIGPHKRVIFTNHFRIEADRGFNAFCINNMKILNGENDFRIVGYLNNPSPTGDTEYNNTKNKLNRILDQCKGVIISPSPEADDYTNIKRVQSDCNDFFTNRLFY